MAFYIGGDTTELEYDFFTKTAGSTIDCPLKIYKGEVDPSALPTPTDAIWSEITSQAVIDKLKAQNEITTSNLATDKSTIQWGDKTLTKTAVVKITDDFAGKVAGSVVENPNISKAIDAGQPILANPSAFNNELGNISYTNIATFNNISKVSVTSLTSGNIPQQLFSFNIIEIVERKFGSIPKETVAEKIEWLVNNLDVARCLWKGYGSNPTGNKVYFSLWYSNTNSWGYSANHSNNTVLELSISATNLITKIDNNGFIHFLAYTDASDGVTASTIYTDYVSIELTLKAPENLITATNTLSDIVTDYTGKVSGSVTENANIAKSSPSNSLISPSDFVTEFNSTNYTLIQSVNAQNSSLASTSVSGGIAKQLFSFNIISAVEKQLGQPIPAVDKVQWCKDNLNKITANWIGYGSCPTGNKAYIKIYNASGGSYLSNTSNTSSSPSSLTRGYTNNVDIANIIDSTGFVHLLTYTDASDGVTPSTIYTDYVKLTIQLKYIPTYDFYTDINTRRDAGLTNIIMVKRQIGDMTSDFAGKVNGSVLENPNIALYSNYTSLRAPSTFNTSAYASAAIVTLNDSCFVTTNTTSGQIPQQLFSFNLIEIAQRALGTSIPGVDTASKVQWLNDNLNTATMGWYGFGSCPSGNLAKLSAYNILSGWGSSGAIYRTHSYNNVQPLQISISTMLNYIDSNGFAHYLAYTDASDGVTASTINTDYVSLKLTFKTDTVGYEYFTNNSSEISVTTNNKASAFLIECDLTPIATALYGGSNASSKSALKSITADIYAMASGANVNQLGYGVYAKLWTDLTLEWKTTGETITSSLNSAISKLTINNITSPAFRVNSTNKIYLLVHSTYKSDGLIASEVNLDYVNIKVKLARTPDVIAPTPITLGDTWSILLKGFSPSWDSTLTNAEKRYLTFVKPDLSDSFTFYRSASGGMIALWWKANAGSKQLKPNVTRTKYQVSNMLFKYENKTITLYELFNNGTMTINTLTNVVISNGEYNFSIGLKDNGTLQADAFIENVYSFNDKTFTDEETEVMLRGRNTIVGKETDAHLNEVATMFQNPKLTTGFILPNNRYKVTGQAKLYCNGYLTRTVQDTEFTTNKYENRIELVGVAEVRRLD